MPATYLQAVCDLLLIHHLFNTDILLSKIIGRKVKQKVKKLKQHYA